MAMMNAQQLIEELRNSSVKGAGCFNLLNESQKDRQTRASGSRVIGKRGCEDEHAAFKKFLDDEFNDYLESEGLFLPDLFNDMEEKFYFQFSKSRLKRYSIKRHRGGNFYDFDEELDRPVVHTRQIRIKLERRYARRMSRHRPIKYRDRQMFELIFPRVQDYQNWGEAFAEIQGKYSMKRDFEFSDLNLQFAY